MAEWQDSIPDQLREAPFFSNADSMDQIIDRLKSASEYQGRSIRIPDGDASEDQVSEWLDKAVDKMGGKLMRVPEEGSDDHSTLFAQLGRPETADKYEMPEGFDEGETVLLKAAALNANITKKQFSDYQKAIAAHRQEAKDTNEAAFNGDMATLVSEWGAAESARMGEVGVFLKNAPNVPTQWLEQFTAGNMPADTIRFLHAMAQAGEEPGEIANQQGPDPVLTVAEAKEKAGELRIRMYKLMDENPQDAMIPILNQKLIQAEAMAMGRVLT